MKIKTATAAVSAALLSLIAAGQAGAAQIYPVDQARFMTNARFDFKIELDKSVARKDVTVQINGADYSKTLSGKEVWMEKEDNVHGSALVVRDVEIKKPGRYEVIVKSPEGEMRDNWDIYTTPEKPVAKNVIILLADGLSVGHRTAARILSKGVTNGMYNAPLAMDDMPHMALLGTSSVDTIAADSANTASAYMTGHKSSVNALGVYADRTQATRTIRSRRRSPSFCAARPTRPSAS
ncbi:MAG: alkaline phosphatase [Sutterella wadsworthensis]